MTEPDATLPDQLASLDHEDREALRDAARIVHARRSVLGFVRLTHRDYDASWVHAKICRELEEFTEAVERGESPRLIICMPPRHGKTAVVSKRWPVWHLGRNPSHEVVCASYGQDLADDNSRAARQVARSEVAVLAFPGLLPKIPEKRYYSDYRRTDVDRVNHWRVGDGGSYKAVGVGGPLTGRGAHVLIIDDPIKDRAEAESPTTRQRIYDWYTSTAYTRLAPGGGVLVMATRWHEDDLIGRLLRAEKEGGDAWRVLSFPAVAEDDEPVADEDLALAESLQGLLDDHAGSPCWRLAGQALHPSRFPARRLGAIKAAIGPRDWAALYQQRPTPASGALFNRSWFLRRYDEDPRLLRCDDYLISLDCSFKKGKDTDHVVAQAWGWRHAEKWKERQGFYLLDQKRQRMNYPETRQMMIDLSAAWPQIYTKLIEDKANGSALLDDLKAALLGLTPFNPGVASKYERAQVGSVPAFRAGDVWLPEPKWAPWIGAYVEEHAGFTGAAGRKDDQVDCTSQALIMWRLGVTNYGDILEAELGWLDGDYL